MVDGNMGLPVADVDLEPRRRGGAGVGITVGIEKVAAGRVRVTPLFLTEVANSESLGHD